MINKIDWFVQTLMIVAAVLVLLSGLIDEKNLFLMRIIQFAVGAWQFCGGLVWAISDFRRPVRIYVLTASLYLLSLVVLYQLKVNYPVFMKYYVFGLPWVFAIVYYVLTWKRAFPVSSGKRGKFLPNINF
jgi:hypothetical protein